MSVFMNSYYDGTNVTPNNVAGLMKQVNAFKSEIKDGVLILYVDVKRKEVEEVEKKD